MILWGHDWLRAEKPSHMFRNNAPPIQPKEKRIHTFPSTCKRTRGELFQSDILRPYLDWNSMNLKIGCNQTAQNNKKNRQIICTYVHMYIITNKYSWAGIFRRTFETRCPTAVTSQSAIQHTMSADWKQRRPRLADLVNFVYLRCRNYFLLVLFNSSVRSAHTIVILTYECVTLHLELARRCMRKWDHSFLQVLRFCLQLLVSITSSPAYDTRLRARIPKSYEWFFKGE